MRTKAKLTLAALGFVAATTGLVIWQSTTPRLEAVAHRVPLNTPFYKFLAWLSPQEAIVYSWKKGLLCFLDLKRGIERPIPCAQSERFAVHVAHEYSFGDQDSNRRFIDQYTVSISPDRKWLVFVESFETKPSHEKRSFFLVHLDGSGLRRIPLPASFSVEKPLWLPDSSGWLAYWESDKRPEYGRTFYALDENVSPREERTRYDNGLRDPLPIAIQADGRLLFARDQNRLRSALCDQNQPDHCEELSFARPAGREKAEVETFLVSHDSQRAVVSLRVEAAKIPERGTWEQLLKRKLPVAYNELWVLSAKGERPRCLVREATTSDRASAFFLYGLSPDGKHALVHGSQDAYYVLPLSRS